MKKCKCGIYIENLCPKCDVEIIERETIEKFKQQQKVPSIITAWEMSEKEINNFEKTYSTVG